MPSNASTFIRLYGRTNLFDIFVQDSVTGHEIESLHRVGESSQLWRTSLLAMALRGIWIIFVLAIFFLQGWKSWKPQELRYGGIIKNKTKNFNWLFISMRRHGERTNEQRSERNWTGTVRNWTGTHCNRTGTQRNWNGTQRNRIGTERNWAGT